MYPPCVVADASRRHQYRKMVFEEYCEKVHSGKSKLEAIVDLGSAKAYCIKGRVRWRGNYTQVSTRLERAEATSKSHSGSQAGGRTKTAKRAVRRSPRLEARKPTTKGAGSSNPSSNRRKPAKSVTYREVFRRGVMLSPVEEGGEEGCSPVIENDGRGVEGQPSTFLSVLKFYSDFLLSYPAPDLPEDSSQWSCLPDLPMVRPMTCGADAHMISKITKLDEVEVQRSLDTLVDKGYAWYNKERKGYSFDHTRMLQGEYTAALDLLPSFNIPPDFYVAPGNAEVQENEVISPAGNVKEKGDCDLEAAAPTPTVTMTDVIWDVIKDYTSNSLDAVITEQTLNSLFAKEESRSLSRSLDLALAELVKDGEIISPASGSYKFNTRRVLPRSLNCGKLEH